ncbi:MAG TPA: PH domain-containing protein [Mycobacteriales bacterium]|nr:PH domain-containing protein [Mycobacteriales bacterium]
MNAGEPVVLRAPWWQYAMLSGWLAAAFALGPHTRLAVLPAVAAAAFAAMVWRTRTELDPGGVTVRRVRGTRRLPWPEVVAFTDGGRQGTLAVTRAGERVALPWVSWRPPAPAAHVAPRTAQAVAAYAAGHGHEVALTP